MKKQIVYLVGAGPGKEDLISLRAIEKIKIADVIIYDYLANKKLLEYSKKGAELIYVGKKGGCHTLNQTEINKLIVEKAKEGKIVVRLKGGDPYIFGRGGEEAEELVKNGIFFEVIPGITSASGATAYAGIPLTHRDFTSSVAFITGHEREDTEYSKIHWDKISTGIGTLVFYMGVKNLPYIVEKLIENGRDISTPVAIIRWGTMPYQQTITGTLENIVDIANKKQIKPPAIIVVGEVVKLREKLRWFDIKPLFGKKIIVTRAREQASELTKKLEEEGAYVIEFPTIEITEPDDYSSLDKAIINLRNYNWIIFTSVNGVKFFLNRLRYYKKDIRELYGLKICTIGPKTAKIFRDFGIEPDYIPEKYQAEYIIEGLKKYGIKGKKFLLPRAEVAREILPEKIKELGGEIDVVIAYKTVMPKDNRDEVLDLLKKGEINYITFTSSSTVKNFIKMIDGNLSLLKNVKLVSIGPITSQTLKNFSLNPTLEAKNFTIEGLVEVILEDNLCGKQ